MDERIERMLNTGYPWPVKHEEFEEPVCPMCGQKAIDFYLDRDDDIIGCDNCVCKVDAGDYLNN